MKRVAPLLSRQIRAEMALKDLTLADVEAATGISQSIISRVLNARPDFANDAKLRLIQKAVKKAPMPKEVAA